MSNNKINFYFENTSFTLKDRKNLKSFLSSIFKNEGKDLQSLTYIFCTDKFLLKINQNYLKHDDYTDIITFDLSETPLCIIGEIYISIDSVKGNSAKFNTSFKQEIHRVMFHGVLHLCGYKDKSKKEKEIMRSKEDLYIGKYFK